MPAKPRELHPDRSARDLYGSEVRRYRNNAGMSLEALSSVVMYSRAHLSRIETAEVVPPPDLSEKLDACFGTDGHFGRLYGVARHEVHPDKYKRRMQLEERARIIEEYSGHIVPGLVQTEEYACAVFRASNPEMSDDEIEDKVSARLSRQQILKSAAPPYLSVILDEAVIRRPIGGPDVMRAQLAGLLPLADTLNTVVQVLPFAHGETRPDGRVVDAAHHRRSAGGLRRGHHDRSLDRDIRRRSQATTGLRSTQGLRPVATRHGGGDPIRYGGASP